MNRYELYLLLHVFGALAWVGGGLMLLVLATQAERASDDARLGEFMERSGAVAGRVFIPSSLLVLGAGLLMVLDGPWSFRDLWITLALCGFLATFLVGVGIMAPLEGRIRALVEHDGGFGRDAAVETRKFLVLARLDSLLLLLIVTDMVVKPTGEDVGALSVMAVVLLIGIAYAAVRIRAIGSERPAAPATG